MKKVIFLLFFIGLTGCIDFRILERWQSKRSIARYDRESKAYYDKETPEQKVLRGRNEKICDDVSGAYSGNWNQILYRDCMKERGSPLF